jgi:hypothetical protein
MRGGMTDVSSGAASGSAASLGSPFWLRGSMSIIDRVGHSISPAATASISRSTAAPGFGGGGFDWRRDFDWRQFDRGGYCHICLDGGCCGHIGVSLRHPLGRSQQGGTGSATG